MPRSCPQRRPGGRLTATDRFTAENWTSGLGFNEVAVSDDGGTRYALSVEEMSFTESHARGPIGMRLQLDPVPALECGWLELRSPDGPAIRLLPSARPPDVRVSQLTPEADSTAGQELPEISLSLLDLADGPAHHLDIAAVLPPVGGITVHVDSLVSEARAWRMYLRAQPRWFTTSDDGSRKRAAASVSARDDRGGMYLATFGGGSGHDGYKELKSAVPAPAGPARPRFAADLPRRRRGAAVDLGLAPAAGS